MKIVVTGASGMLGTALLSRQWDGVTWTGVDIQPPATQLQDRVTSIHGDVRNTKAMTSVFRGADVVVHAAAALPSHRSADIRSVDVDGTRSVLQAARAANIDRLVHISSTAVYGLPKVCPTPEDYACQPVDAYSTAKLAAERLVESARRDGLCAPILRPKTFLGEERLGLFAMLFEWAHEGHNFPLLGGGRIRTQMLDVDDLCETVRQACIGPDNRVNDTFNVGARHFGTLREDFQSVLDAAGHGKRIVAVPVAPAVVALRALAALQLSPVYKRLIHKLMRDSYVATDKAVEILGFAPRYSNEQTLLRTFEWWRSSVATKPRRAHGQTHRDPWKQGALRLAKAIC